MQKITLLKVLLLCISVSIVISFKTLGPQAKHILALPFRTVKFIQNSIFFTTNNRKFFGFINTETRGQIQVAYQLQENERILDEFQMGDKLIIGNKNRLMIFFQPVTRIFTEDHRFVNHNFNQLRAFKQINGKAYVISDKAVLYFKIQVGGAWSLVKQLLSNQVLNPGVSQNYYDLYLFPTKKLPERVIVLTTAIFQKSQGEESDKLLSCFKWFEGQNQQVDGKCIIQQRIDIQDYRITGKWAYLRMPTQTYVFDQTLTMRTKWEHLPTQYVAGHAVTADHLTYLYKTNELAYYRLVQNYENDDIKMTADDNSLFISKKGKRIIKLNKPNESQVIGTWLIELDQISFKTLIQYDSGDLHCYKITKNQESTQINYLFRLAPQRKQSQNKQKQEKMNDSDNQVKNENEQL